MPDLSRILEREIEQGLQLDSSFPISTLHKWTNIWTVWRTPSFPKVARKTHNFWKITSSHSLFSWSIKNSTRPTYHQNPIKFENWWSWSNYFEKYSRIIAIMSYLGFQICREISSKIHQTAQSMVQNASNEKMDTISTLKCFNALVWKNNLLVKNHGKVNFLSLHRRFMSSNSAQGA